MQESGRYQVSKAEEIERYSTISTVHFTDSIVLNAHESENITGLSTNRYKIIGVNIQSKQPLKYLVEFYSTDTFDSTNIDTDSFIDHIELDLANGYPAFRVNNANQYKLNSGGHEVIYEDDDLSKELHVTLHNLSPLTKNAGITGAVQLDFKLSPRL